MTRVLVVGGGISGLATALLLSRQGDEVDLVERQERVETLGSGITLIGAALRALDKLGVYDECLANGFGISDFDTYKADGTLDSSFPLPSPVGSDEPGMIGMMRPTLHRILLDRAAVEGTTVRTGTSPVRVEQDADGVTVEFNTGATEVYDVLIGADGFRSTVRDLVFGHMTPEFQGQGILRVVLPRPAEVVSEIQFHTVGDVFIGFTPTAPDRMYMYITFPVEEGYRPDRAELVELARKRIEPFAGIAALVREDIREPEQINYTSFETMVVPAPWYRGRVALTGDAAHCPTPHLAAGAAMCLEDAVALAEALATAPTLDEALNGYSDRRHPRCKFVVETGNQLSYWQTHPGTPGADHQGVIAAAFEKLAGPF
ncbi:MULTISPECIES: FAD-dependent oxidoreductase [Streptomyces phaeochromogenes group]|uniref:FAD-dependent oxidoreductase n=1 Tax=Streptomyces phaeochromogenes group TaxID=2838332 RepID=UPI0033DAEEB6|nr:FAD-dependent oxidoreductase [Streptomyces phaeochromogenes]